MYFLNSKIQLLTSPKQTIMTSNFVNRTLTASMIPLVYNRGQQTFPVKGHVVKMSASGAPGFFLNCSVLLLQDKSKTDYP